MKATKQIVPSVTSRQSMDWEVKPTRNMIIWRWRKGRNKYNMIMVQYTCTEVVLTEISADRLQEEF
jgi:hypothetical protein